MDNVSKVEHQPTRNQFVCEGGAVLEYEFVDPDQFVITHTRVPVNLRGRGIAAKLAEVALNYAEQNQLKVIPQCSYIASYMERRSS